MNDTFHPSRRLDYLTFFAARAICMNKGGEVLYTYFGMTPREVGLAQSAPQQISEGRPHFYRRGL